MDVLSDILGMVHLSSTVFAQTQLAPPWGIRAEAYDAFAFHVLLRGSAWLEVDGLAPVEVTAGDVVVVMPGRGHSVRDRLATRPRDLFEMIAAGGFDRPAFDRPAADQPAVSAQLICGCFRMDGLPARALLAELPPVIHLGALSGDVGPWLGQTIKLLTYEFLADRPGAATVVNRLCDALFVYLLRGHLAGLPDDRSSWLRALVDPQVGTALRLIHDAPAQPWTVASLAVAVGMSRSAFAARFTQVVGEAPMGYLTRWRLEKAATLLLPGTAAVSQVATAVGYDSAAAFSKAFKRAVGVAPGAYRRGLRTGAA